MLEASVGWLVDADQEVADLLAAASPLHSAAPGDRDVLRWCGIRSADGRLVACAAHAEHVRGVPHLASIATLPDHRRRGLGTTVTGWLTRTLLGEGAGVVTLGMYADNTDARPVYRRLGFRNDHHFSSGRLRTT